MFYNPEIRILVYKKMAPKRYRLKFKLEPPKPAKVISTESEGRNIISTESEGRNKKIPSWLLFSSFYNDDSRTCLHKLATTLIIAVKSHIRH
jgi:hypothetical protein